MLRNALVEVEHTAHGAAGHLRGGEHFFRLALAGEVDGVLHHLLCLFRCPNSDGHNHACTDEKPAHAG